MRGLGLVAGGEVGLSGAGLAAGEGGEAGGARAVGAGLGGGALRREGAVAAAGKKAAGAKEAGVRRPRRDSSSLRRASGSEVLARSWQRSTKLPRRRASGGRGGRGLPPLHSDAWLSPTASPPSRARPSTNPPAPARGTLPRTAPRPRTPRSREHASLH